MNELHGWLSVKYCHPSAPPPYQPPSCVRGSPGQRGVAGERRPLPVSASYSAGHSLDQCAEEGEEEEEGEGEEGEIILRQLLIIAMILLIAITIKRHHS